MFNFNLNEIDVKLFSTLPKPAKHCLNQSAKFQRLFDKVIKLKGIGITAMIIRYNVTKFLFSQDPDVHAL